MTEIESMEEVQPESGGTLAGRIEAILFVAGEAVRIEEMAKALNVSVRAVENEIAKLRDEYDFHQRGFTLKRFGHQVQLATRALYAADVVHLLQPVQKQSLTQAAMETLAVVAYKQPVTRAEVEQVRGVKCDYSIQSLMKKELIMEVGRKEALGRPILYGTTENFLSHFGQTSLEDLPPIEKVNFGEPLEQDVEQMQIQTEEAEKPVGTETV